MNKWIAAFIGLAYFTVGAALIHALLVDAFSGSTIAMALAVLFMLGLTALVCRSENDRRLW